VLRGSGEWSRSLCRSAPTFFCCLCSLSRETQVCCSNSAQAIAPMQEENGRHAHHQSPSHFPPSHEDEGVVALHHR
jgi:hypothetical protein